MRTWAWPLLLLVLAGCAAQHVQPGPSRASASQDLSASTLAARALGHVVSVRAQGRQGSGFFVHPDLVLTCLHVVRGRTHVQLQNGVWSGNATAVVAWSEADDLALLRVTPERPGAGIELSTAATEIGAKVMVVSSPLGLDSSISDGIVSAQRSEPRALMQFTAPISPGSSGGPLLNMRGQVVGIVTSTLTAVEGGTTYAQNLNFGVPVERLRLLTAGAQDVPLGEFADRTLSDEERHWHEIESSLVELESSLTTELGVRVGHALASTLRVAASKRDVAAAEALAKRWRALKEERAALLVMAEQLRKAGVPGPALGQRLLWTWEQYALSPNDDTALQFEAARAGGQAHLTEQRHKLRLPNFPAAFAGFKFMAPIGEICSACYATCAIDDFQGLRSMGCPSLPVAPPFATRAQTVLGFLDGKLVSVSVGVSIYQDAVQAITAKYGQPHFLAYKNEHWVGVENASFGNDTAFEWALKGGRIRVGQRTDAPFAVFIRAERDAAVSASF